MRAARRSPRLVHRHLLVRSPGGAFQLKPGPLRAADFGCDLPTPEDIEEEDDGGQESQRQHILLETLAALEKASATAHYHALALRNLERWAASASAGLPADGPAASAKRPKPGPNAVPPARCTVHVLPGDWGEVTLAMTKRYGAVFASLNMANAYGPGGGYTHGMVAQEENMFRRTDCHFALGPELMGADGLYTPEMTALLNAEAGGVLLDAAHPRVCVRGAEERGRSDLGYRWLADADVFLFWELRAAALDLRGAAPRTDDARAAARAEMARRVAAQLDTLIAHGVRHAVFSAFGCGAFENPAEDAASAYLEALRARADAFDVVAFGIFNAGYGPNNFAPFEVAFAGWAVPFES